MKRRNLIIDVGSTLYSVLAVNKTQVCSLIVEMIRDYGVDEAKKSSN